MRFKLDENLPRELAALLVARGHDVHDVFGEGLQGGKDRVIADHCRAEQRTIIALDLDFADIRAYPPALYAGIIVVRIATQHLSHLLDVVVRGIELLEDKSLSGKLWIMSESNVRVRSE